MALDVHCVYAYGLQGSTGPPNMSYLGISFSNEEWGTFYFIDLNVQEPRKYHDGEDIREYEKNRRDLFVNSLAKLPLLGRIYDYYRDVSFSSDEIERLYFELNRVKLKIKSEKGRGFLEGLQASCRIAIHENAGLFLHAD